jgi:hypothetical protein
MANMAQAREATATRVRFICILLNGKERRSNVALGYVDGTSAPALAWLAKLPTNPSGCALWLIYISTLETARGKWGVTASENSDDRSGRRPPNSGGNMIYDHRTYTCRPGTIQRQMQLYAEHGWAVHRRHLGEPLLFAVTETGNVNSYVHIWVFESAADREQKRARLQQDPEWSSYLQKSAEAGNLISQTNMILKAAPFFAALALRS